MRVSSSYLRPRWAKVLIDLWDSKLRTVLVVASIAVGVFTVGTIASTYLILSDDMNVSYAASNPANIEIWTDPFDENFLTTIKNIPGVKEAEGRYIMDVQVSRDGEEWVSLDLVAIEDYESADINLRNPVDGLKVPGEREVIVIKSNFNDSGILLGDDIQIQLASGAVRTLPVVGTATEQSAGRADFMALPHGYISTDTLAWLEAPESFNRLMATVSGDSDSEEVFQQVSGSIEDKLEKSGRTVYRTRLAKTNEHPMSSLILAILGVLLALGILVVLLSSSLIANTLNALLTQHIRQIGVMKLVGARSFQILGMYLMLILAFGIIAALIAIPLGAVGGYALADYIASLASITLQGFRFIPQVVLLQVAIALLVPLGAGFIPVNTGSKTNVRRAISGNRSGQQGSNANWFDRLLGKIAWISRPVLLSIRNTFRRKGRLALTLFTLILGGAIFIAVFNVSVSMEQYIEQLGKYFIADISLNFDRPYRISEIEQIVLQVPGVESVEGWSAAVGEIIARDGNENDDITILAPPAETKLIHPEMITGRWIYPGENNTLVVSDGIWEFYPDLQPGDTLPMEVQGKREAEWTVVGIFHFTSMLDTVFAYADYEVISDILNSSNRSFSYRVVTDEHSWERQQEVSIVLNRYLRERGYQVGEVEAGLATLRDASEMINILIAFLLIMAMLTALVGSIGLTGTMGMNVLERTREIGVMRAIGAVDLKIINSVIIEGMLIGLISWGFAVLMSFPISFLLLRIISQSMLNAPIDLALTPLGSGIWLLVVMMLAVLASVLPARSAARLTIREVLAYE